MTGCGPLVLTRPAARPVLLPNGPGTIWAAGLELAADGVRAWPRSCWLQRAVHRVSLELPRGHGPPGNGAARPARELLE